MKKFINANINKQQNKGEKMQELKYPDSYNLCSVLIMGLCSRGPYRYAKDNLENSTVRWMNWSYHHKYVHPQILTDIKLKKIHQGSQIIFCHWNLNMETRGKLLRKGIIDHIAYEDGHVSFTVFLGDIVTGSIDLPEKDHYLCRYVDSANLKVEMFQ